MAKHIWLVTYAVGEALEERRVSADYVDDDGPFVAFHEDPDSATGAGGPVLLVATESVLSVERITKPAAPRA